MQWISVALIGKQERKKHEGLKCTASHASPHTASQNTRWFATQASLLSSSAHLHPCMLNSVVSRGRSSFPGVSFVEILQEKIYRDTRFLVFCWEQVGLKCRVNRRNVQLNWELHIRTLHQSASWHLEYHRKKIISTDLTHKGAWLVCSILLLILFMFLCSCIPERMQLILKR